MSQTMILINVCSNSGNPSFYHPIRRDLRHETFPKPNPYIGSSGKIPKGDVYDD